jgi:hypothetical protein
VNSEKELESFYKYQKSLEKYNSEVDKTVHSLQKASTTKAR